MTFFVGVFPFLILVGHNKCHGMLPVIYILCSWFDGIVSLSLK